MRHYLSFKFNKDSDLEEILKVINTTYQSLATAITGFRSYEIQKNCVDRLSNFDLMIIMDMTHRDILNTYLSHPYHLDLVKILTPNIEHIMTFDCE